MFFNKKIFQVTLDTSASGNNTQVVTDALHDLPFKNLTIWIRPLDAAATYNYVVDYGGAVQASGSKTGGALATFYDAQIQPPNNPNANWSEQFATNPDNLVVPFVVGMPIDITVTNTTAKKVVYNISIISESETWT